ncbi:MAG: PorT family protein [Mediterranea sp.]|jgi:hypothetical protein|nr:PorT family protein [Mediterranea sp.]
MKKVNDELTNLFRTRLEDVEMPVREGFWEKLQQDIPVAISRRRLIVYRFSAVASVLLILAGASAAFWYFSPKEEIAKAFTRFAVSAGTTGKMGKDVVHEELPVIHASSASPAPASLKLAAVTEEYPDEESFSVSFSMSFSFSSSSASAADTQNRTANGYEGNMSYAGGFDREHTASQATEEALPVESVEKKKHRTWSVGVFASGGLLDERVHSPEAIKYERPVSAGLSVRKELTDRWGVESGWVYTHLKSDQSLHYVGIPVKTDLSFYKNKRVNLYASAGGMVEKCVGGNVKPAPLQFSLNAALGVQYKLTDRLSLYTEPGLSYHFDDGSPVMTIRKERPLNINLLCGVRMTY